MTYDSESRPERASFPQWFTSVDSLTAWQASLFTETMDDVLATLRVSSDELDRWHQRGWTSFGSDFAEELDEPHVNEIRFVRDVVRAGLNDAMVAALFSELPKPMNFDPLRVAYSFSLGWVQSVIRKEPDVYDLIETHLDDWLSQVAANDVDRLRLLRDRLDELIVSTEA